MKAQITKYAEIQGVHCVLPSGYGRWWLRSPSSLYSYYAGYVEYDGTFNHTGAYINSGYLDVGYTGCGIRPVITLIL